MLKLKILILILLTLESISFSQDTIDFKLYDSLKTKTEDSHRGKLSGSIPSKADTFDGIKNINFIDTVKSTDRILHDSVVTKKVTVKSVKLITNDPDNLDARLFRTINSSRSPFKDAFFTTVTHTVLPVSMMLPSSMFLYGRTYKKHYDENSGYLLAGALTTNIALTMGAKLIFQRDRPCDCMKEVYSRKEFADKYSFPSAHASFSFTSATLFALRYPKYPQVYAPMFAWALLSAYSRPYLGMHFPSDVLAGAVIGAGSSILVYSLRKELFTLKNNVLDEEIRDEGSINGGTVTFFAGSFLISSIVSNFILKSNNPEKMNLSTGFDENGGKLNFNVKF